MLVRAGCSDLLYTRRADNDKLTSYFISLFGRRGPIKIRLNINRNSVQMVLSVQNCRILRSSHLDIARQLRSLLKICCC
jgi:hypothetical protein